MSSPEKRDDRSMSDILASIRKIMAQEPALAVTPGPTRTSLNGVSGAALDLPRTPELKLPAQNVEAETAAPVSLDELLADTPRAAPPPPVAPNAKPAGAELAPPVADAKPAVPMLDAPAPAKEVGAAPPAKQAAHVPTSGLAAKTQPLGPPAPTKEPASAAVVGPPAPKLNDLGSVVPGKFDPVGPAPSRESVASPDVKDERPVLGPPLAGPLLGEPSRTSLSADAIPEVPGADALRRLIAGVIPPSAHPSLAPAPKTPEPTPAIGRMEESVKAASKAEIKTDAAPKPVPDAKAEAKPTAVTPPVAEKKLEPVVPAALPLPAPMPAAAAAPKPAAVAPAPVVTPAPKPAAPVTATPPAPEVVSPVAKAANPVNAKTMDETVVELLRPLLREWLNTNMPRLIEPALKAELEALRNAMAREKKD
jgi:cell pole-organizing protein PopZ